MHVTRKRRNGISGVDLSPMLDVIFQLILFFLVSTTFAVLPGLKMNLPQSSTSVATDARGVTISVEESGAIYFNDEPVSLDELPSKFASVELGENFTKETFPVSVSADENVTNGTIVKIFDAIRTGGFSCVSLRTSERK